MAAKKQPKKESKKESKKELKKEPKKGSKKIKDMLLKGQLVTSDPQTGFQHSLYAGCPECGYACSVSRIERSGAEITRVVFRCTICCEDFDATIEKMFLR